MASHHKSSAFSSASTRWASPLPVSLVGRVSPKKLLTGGLLATALGGVTLLLAVLAHLGLIGILPALFVVVASMGMVLPNATALALADHARTAGSASALVGVLQYAIGAVAAPLVGIAGTHTALPMALVIAILGIAALLTFFLLGRPRLHQSPL